MVIIIISNSIIIIITIIIITGINSSAVGVQLAVAESEATVLHVTI